ncbi:MAG: SDR family oxidoreductase [Pseudomonadota bacterium]
MQVALTGGGNGCGAALTRRLAAAGARVSLADRDLAAAQRVATGLDGQAFACDVGEESQLQQFIADAEAVNGPIDCFCSNAGLAVGEGEHAASASNATWDTLWRVHVMAHVWAARALLPAMLARGDGYFVNIASAAGVLSQIGDAAYSTTKHAAVGFAESLAISHGDQGIGVSVVCPQYVATPLLGYDDGPPADAGANLLSPEAVAEHISTAIAERRFMVLTHPDVAGFMQAKANDPDRWIGGMRKLRRNVIGTLGELDLAKMHRLI